MADPTAGKDLVKVRMRMSVASGTTAWDIDREYEVHAETAAAWVRDGVAEAVGGEAALKETDPITAPDAAGLVAGTDAVPGDAVRPKVPERQDATDDVPEDPRIDPAATAEPAKPKRSRAKK